MNTKRAIQLLKEHVREEGRIHKEFLEEAKGDAKHLFKKHWVDTLAIHKAFWKDLKKSLKKQMRRF